MYSYGNYLSTGKDYYKIGCFSGSNWDVPSGESNQIVDNAIKIFEEIHPNVKVKYESGILKEDYSSWLADKILTGDTPDVYIILEEDFSLLSSIGALKILIHTYLKIKISMNRNIIKVF